MSIALQPSVVSRVGDARKPTSEPSVKQQSATVAPTLGGVHYPEQTAVVGELDGPNETVQKASPDRLAKYNYNEIVSAHKEVYASFRSDELQTEVDRVFKEKSPTVRLPRGQDEQLMATHGADIQDPQE